MERQTESTLFNFPKLSSTNYSSWKIDMKVLLIDRNCWEFIEGDTDTPVSDASTSTEAEQKLKWRREKAYTTIYQGVERQYLPLISDTTDGRKAWEILKRNFEPKSRARLASLIDEFYELKFNQNDESIGIFCRRVQEKKQLIKEAGFEMPEALVCFQLIRKLPPDYDNLVQLLYRLEDDQFTFTNIESQLINESGRISQKNKDRGLDIVANAYVTKAPNSQSTRCGPTTNRSGTALGHQNESRFPTRRKFCHYCKKQGHEIPECYKRQDRERKSRLNFKPQQSQAPQRFFYSELPDDGEHCYSTKAPEDLEEWLIDSAATSHFCKERGWFDDFRELPESEALIGDKDCKSKICGVGKITFYVYSDDRFSKLTLNNVYYAPNMRRNLISGAKIDLAGYKIIWHKSKMVVYNKFNEYFITIPRKQKLYVLSGLPSKTYESNFVSNVSSNAELMHRRFCHINYDLISKMSKSNSVHGLEKLQGNLNSCMTCNLTKTTRSTFKPIANINSKSVLDKVHMDIWGPAPVKTPAGSNYFLSIIDDYSRYVTVYIIKNKSDVFDCFTDYLVSAERQLNKKLKCVHTDNGLEFCNTKFENYLKSLGIKIERTSSYSPEQNGVAERYNRTAIEGVRAMLQDSGLNGKFWGEALQSFVHVRNRCEHKLTKGKTPAEIWFRRKPSTRHFRVFGSVAYTHIPKVKRNKLQNNANVGIFIGYASQTKGYRVWLPKLRKVIESIHVKIDESKNGVETLFGQKSNEYVKLPLSNEYLYDNESKESVTEVKEVKTYPEKLKLDITKWKRVEKPRTKSSRIDVYYYPPSGERLRSSNDVIKYCNKNKLEYKPENFNFKPSQSVVDSTSDEESENELSNLTTDIFEEVYSIEIPRNFEQSQLVPERDNWNEAMRDEITTMNERKVWKLVKPPPNVKVIGCRWVYSVKKDENDKIKRFKARLVALGYNQTLGIDYNSIFSPVVNFSIVKLLFILLVILLGWKHEQLDVKSAYLYGNLKEVIYMKQPPGYSKSNDSRVCLLQKSIYGLHQSGRVWNDELDCLLKSVGFENLGYCNCVYKLKSNDVILLVHVDDCILFGKNQDSLNSILSILKEKLDIVNLGNVRYFLGVNFESENGKVYLHQITYINKLKERFKELPKSFVNIPFKDDNLMKNVSDPNEDEREIMRKYPYRSIIGCLSFLSDRSRPDISFSVNTMSQFCNNYSFQHYLKVVDILNYVFNTSDYKMDLSNVNNYDLFAYSDANWGSHLTNRHSSSGYLIYFSNVVISWKSCKQKCIALSSMESEFIALTETVKELLWFKNVLNEINLISVSEPVLYCDNRSAIYFCENKIENSKTKHIDIRLHFIRELLAEEKFMLKCISSKLNLADLLTKPQSKERLKYFVSKLFACRGADCRENQRLCN